MEPEVRERFEMIESILASMARANQEAQARHDKWEAELEARLLRMDARQQRHEIRMNEHEKRMNEHEKRMNDMEAKAQSTMNSIRKLIVQGMKMIAQAQEDTKQLKASQRETDRKLQAFLDSLNKGGNGRSGRSR